MPRHPSSCSGSCSSGCRSTIGSARDACPISTEPATASDLVPARTPRNSGPAAKAGLIGATKANSFMNAVEELEDLELVNELRDTEARRFTLLDAPLHTAIYHPAEETLNLWK